MNQYLHFDIDDGGGGANAVTDNSATKNFFNSQCNCWHKLL